MLLRAIGAAALTLSFSLSVTSNALAGSQPGLMRRVSCTVVRYYVERYSASAAETWARSHGATDAQIDAARRCLKDTPSQTAQAAGWDTR
ncbi:MAG TPA: hypothetical protein VM910_27660 [Bradyrhizobium sp.]|jgi:hypothetical protein|nr:hypothetical protein [Bradyrhizobium sp.]